MLRFYNFHLKHSFLIPTAQVGIDNLNIFYTSLHLYFIPHSFVLSVPHSQIFLDGAARFVLQF